MPSKKRFKSNSADATRIKLTPDRKEADKYINWFPGHMNKAIRQIKEKVKLVDIILEIRDARTPLISKNPAMDEVLGQKLRLVIFNKANLADERQNLAWEKYLTGKENFLFTNALDKKAVEEILARSKQLIEENYLKENPEGKNKNKKTMMIIGLPNTGKSTLINRLSGRNATRTADKPGYTQSQQWIKLEGDLELLDTPGIMPPKIEDYEDGLKLATIYAIPSKIVPEETTAWFLAKFLLEHYPNVFEERYGFSATNLSFGECLEQIGQKRMALIKKGEIDFERVYRILLNDFREGKLGRITLESPPA